MPFTDFYNMTLEHIDFMEEYRTWQSYGNSSRSDVHQPLCFILLHVIQPDLVGSGSCSFTMVEFQSGESASDSLQWDAACLASNEEQKR